MDYSSPGSSVHGILQGRSWSGYPFPSPGDRPNTVIEPGSPALQADSLLSELPGPIILSILFIYLSTCEESGENQLYHHLFRLISLGKLNFLYCILSLH